MFFHSNPIESKRDHSTPIQWHSQGGLNGGGGSHEVGKIAVKMMLFPKDLFLVRTFPETVKNAVFLLSFHQNFSKFSQTFPVICVFRPNA